MPQPRPSARADAPGPPEGVIARSRAMARVMEQVAQVAGTRAGVLLAGEAGAGKGVIARILHRDGPRPGAPFVAFDCGASPEPLLEAELFGVEPGAAGAPPGPRRGRIELAEGGTLFLESVEALPPVVQLKLLRVLQDREFERAGGGRTVRADLRLIAASHEDLGARVRDGRFREELLVRLGLVRIAVPPLRERGEDLPLLVAACVREFARTHHRRVTGVTPGVLERLRAHPWPGNVRELRNTLEGMVVFAHGRRPLDLADLPPHLRGPEHDRGRIEAAVGMTVEEVERRLIAATLEHTGHDKPRAAAMLGIGLRTLYRKVKAFGLR